MSEVLTPAKVKKAKAAPGQTRIDFPDDGQKGLVLRVGASGKKSWSVTYRARDARGGMRRMTIGEFPEMTLKAARTEAQAVLGRVASGKDPQAEKLAARHAAKQAAADNFATVVEDYYRRYQIGKARNSSAGQVRDTLLNKCEAWHARPVDSITPAEIGALVEGIRDSGHPYGANLLFSYLRHFFRWCAQRDVGYAAESPMEGLQPPFADVKPRDRWYSPEEIAALWHAASKLGVYEGAFLRVLLLTGKRKSALAKMRHDDIGSDGWWRMGDATAPRAKKLNLPIPLPTPALKIVRGLPKIDKNPFLFVGRGEGVHLSPTTKLQKKIQVASGVEDFYFHAVRDTLATHLRNLRVPGNAARRYTDHAQTRDAHEIFYTHDELNLATEDAADTWGRFVRLVARPRVWAKISAFLECEDVAEGDDRREVRRARNREFCQLIQGGGKKWTAWVRGIARPAPEATKVMKLRP